MKSFILIAYLGVTLIFVWGSIWYSVRHGEDADETLKVAFMLGLFWPLMGPLYVVFFILSWPYYLLQYLERRRVSLPKATISK